MRIFSSWYSFVAFSFFDRGSCFNPMLSSAVNRELQTATPWRSFQIQGPDAASICARLTPAMKTNFLSEIPLTIRFYSYQAAV